MTKEKTQTITFSLSSSERTKALIFEIILTPPYIEQPRLNAIYFYTPPCNNGKATNSTHQIIYLTHLLLRAETSF